MLRAAFPGRRLTGRGKLEHKQAAQLNGPVVEVGPNPRQQLFVGFARGKPGLVGNEPQMLVLCGELARFDDASPQFAAL